jgi:hypothetical protein
MTLGRPSEYNETFVTKAIEYLALCTDKEVEKGSTDRPIYSIKVKLPTIEGLAVFLGINKTTVYEWEKKYPEFSNVIERLRGEQADRLVNNGLSGDYNPTIAKVLLTKHGYREGLDQTTNDKDIPVPILNALRNNNSDKEGS